MSECFLEGLGWFGIDGNIVEPKHEPAKYIWVSIKGVKITLCEPCCMQWRRTHAPELTPVSITMIDQEE